MKVVICIGVGLLTLYTFAIARAAWRGYVARGLEGQRMARDARARRSAGDSARR